jgi:hypothetical protein
MLDVKEAARKASEYFAGLYSDKEIENVQLEEVEISDDGKYWLITLSYPVFPLEISSVQFIGKRKYKLFTIDAETGQVKSMKIREVE